jgi:hypothetical protein
VTLEGERSCADAARFARGTCAHGNHQRSIHGPRRRRGGPVYTTHFGFTLLSNAAPAFADVVRVKRVHMAGVAVPFEVVLTRVASR